MIKQIYFENYKAFKSGLMKIKPITILLGANSVGKSSIINLILMLQQTANCHRYKSALRLYGENVSLGESENIFRNKDITKNICIGFTFDSEELKDLLNNNLLNDYVSFILRPLHFMSLKERKSFFDDYDRGINIHKKISSNLDKNSFENILGKIYQYKNFRNNDDIHYYYFNNNRIWKSISKDKSKYVRIFEFLSKLKEIDDEEFKINFECIYVKNLKDEHLIKIKQIVLKTKTDKIILKFEFHINDNKTCYEKIDVTSSFYDLDLIYRDNEHKDLLDAVNYNSTIFSCFESSIYRRDMFSFVDEDNEISNLASILIKIIGEAIDSIKSQFTKGLVNHVSPLRAHPRRYYFLDKANINTVLDTLDGNSLTEILKENIVIKDKVNSWFEKFGLSVDVSTLQDVIHTLKIHQYSLDLDITDVGFGISQILPIIVQGFLSFNKTLTMIEQPEIHLHPKMQAELADLFIDMAEGITLNNYNKKYLLIETHSEYLLKRLIRRISENVIQSNDVAIYFIEPPKNDSKESSSEIIEKEISQDGILDWPRDFYEGELQKDNLNYIKQLFSSTK